MIDFRICELHHCKSLIEDLTEIIKGYNINERKSYAPKHNPNLGYRLNDCMAIYVLTQITSDGETIKSVHLMEDPREDLEVHFEDDGYYKVTKIVIPTHNILSNESFMDDDIWPQYGKIRYFYYAPLCKFFKLIPKKYEESIIRGKVLISDICKDGVYVEPKNDERPMYLIIDNKSRFVNILDKKGQAVKNNDQKVLLTESEEEGKYKIYSPDIDEDANTYALYYIDSFDHKWLEKNVCFVWEAPDKPEFPFLPNVEGYDYIPVETEEIIESCDGWITTIRETKEVFSICRFRECVFRRNSEFIKDCPSKCISQDEEDGLMTIMWLNSSLQVLEFLLHCGRYIEAMQLLEQLNVCGGPCAEYKKGTKNGCGCGKKR